MMGESVSVPVRTVSLCLKFISDESNIRQIAYALDTERKIFNYRPPVYLMSEHAMHSQIPQIINGFGFDGAIMRTHFMNVWL